jgi:hypothetical protein
MSSIYEVISSVASVKKNKPKKNKPKKQLDDITPLPLGRGKSMKQSTKQPLAYPDSSPGSLRKLSISPEFI